MAPMDVGNRRPWYNVTVMQYDRLIKLCSELLSFALLTFRRPRLGRSVVVMADGSDVIIRHDVTR